MKHTVLIHTDLATLLLYQNLFVANIEYIYILQLREKQNLNMIDLVNGGISLAKVLLELI